ncbi:unnamed protein product [Linum trigynum]|uniref:Uncharacterized protein n=1 Tax=Linum trigynum TaxID=586398 RepID=A0AAV2E1H1_9ROSI
MLASLQHHLGVPSIVMVVVERRADFQSDLLPRIRIMVGEVLPADKNKISSSIASSPVESMSYAPLLMMLSSSHTIVVCASSSSAFVLSFGQLCLERDNFDRESQSSIQRDFNQASPAAPESRHLVKAKSSTSSAKSSKSRFSLGCPSSSRWRCSFP